MKKLVLVMVLALVLLTSCSPKNLFFVDSTAVWTWDRATGKMTAVWKFKTLPAQPDSIPVSQPVVLAKDSLDSSD